jgi:hypothetical protein
VESATNALALMAPKADKNEISTLLSKINENPNKRVHVVYKDLMAKRLAVEKKKDLP